jgi:uncharacterized protein YndB with AHSA1/START domain
MIRSRTLAKDNRAAHAANMDREGDALMPANEYHMVSHWSVRATPEEVWEIITQPQEYPRWWPSAFTRALPIQTGDETGVARVTRVETRGFLPYLLHWHVVATELDRPRRLVNKVWGDFEGLGEWTLEQEGEYTHVTYDWRISVHMPLVQVLSPLLKPLFVMNHRWAMKKGEQSIALEVERRRAVSESARAAIAAPPKGIELSTWAVGLGVVLLAVLVLKRR